MDNHPIPQDITGFQFKLVGKMTVRQFIYVGVGVFLAWLIYFILKPPLFVSLPLALLFSLGGAALAFLPIDGRPMDVMIGNFIRAVIAPTKYIYEKQGGNVFSPGQTVTNRQVSQPVNIQPVAHAQATPAVPPVIAQPAPIPAPFAPSPTPAPEQKIESEEKKVEAQEAEVQSQIKSAKSPQEETQLEEKLNGIIKQKEELEKELADLKAKLESQNQAPSAPPPVQTVPEPTNPTPQYGAEPATPQPPLQTPTAPEPIMPSAIPSPTAAPNAPTPQPQPSAQGFMTRADMAFPDEPNLITGAVKDSRGNPLQNILVEVKDEEDNPVRAFKTNARGEFASATSLPNGNYTVALEDPKMTHKFDITQIQATGAPIAPLTIISIDPREELRRELFN